MIKACRRRSRPRDFPSDMNLVTNPGRDTRRDAMLQWLGVIAPSHSLDLSTLEPASADASFRRYFRLRAGPGTAIVMDAPPSHEDCRPFVHVTRLLHDVALNVPRVLAQNLDDGFLLLSDLGRDTFYHAIGEGLDDARLQSMYRGALGALVRMQQASTTGLAAFDARRLLDELSVFPEWYARTHCQAELTAVEQDALGSTFGMLVADNAAQPHVLVHRDFHSPNLMVGAHDDAPGIIDYQDALAGPITYDIASLVMDARTTWEEPQQLDWAIRYWQAARSAGLPVGDDFAEFHRAYEWMGLQRNLRILGVFARLSHRDGKHHYLDHMPRVSAYVRQVAARYNVFRPLLRILDRLENRQAATGFTF